MFSSVKTANSTCHILWFLFLLNVGILAFSGDVCDSVTMDILMVSFNVVFFLTITYIDCRYSIIDSLIFLRVINGLTTLLKIRKMFSWFANILICLKINLIKIDFFNLFILRQLILLSISLFYEKSHIYQIIISISSNFIPLLLGLMA